MYTLRSLLVTPALIASLVSLATSATAAVFRSYDGTDASINATTWALSDDGFNYDCSTKPAKGTPGLAAPWISGTEKATATSKALAFKLDNSTPVDGENLQKLHYLIISSSNGNSPQVESPTNTRFLGFAFKFDTGYTLSNGPVEPIGT